jgi:hypothetical protein
MIRIAGRVLLDMLTVASLLVCVAAGGAWGRSYWRDDFAVFDACGRSFSVKSLNQRIGVEWTSGPFYARHPWQSEPAGHAVSFGEFFRVRHDVYALAPARGDVYRWLGFYGMPAYAESMILPDRTVWITAVGVPYYFVFWSAALLPAIRGRRAVVRRRRRRRVAAGRCGACGYDCRATPDRCPECGAVRPVEAADEATAAAPSRSA